MKGKDTSAEGSLLPSANKDPPNILDLGLRLSHFRNVLQLGSLETENILLIWRIPGENVKSPLL